LIGVVTVNGGRRFLLRYERASSNRGAARYLSDRKEDETNERASDGRLKFFFLGRVPAMRCVGDLERSHVMIREWTITSPLPYKSQVMSPVRVDVEVR